MAGMLSKGITLSYKESTASSYTALTNLQSIPDLGGDSDSVEVTVLSDDAHMYIKGIKDYGDSLEFVFLYEPTQFGTLSAMAGNYDWQVGIPDGTLGAIDTVCHFSGECSVKLTGIGINEAMTYSLSVKPTSSMVWA